MLFASAYLVHHDAAIYPDPYAFRPERFLEQTPGTYTWIPFGGGRRRCLGASFALLEMKLVLRAALERYELRSPARARGHAPARHHLQPLRRLPRDPHEPARPRPQAGTGARGRERARTRLTGATRPVAHSQDASGLVREIAR